MGLILYVAVYSEYLMDSRYPWARHGARFTRDFEDWVAWLAVRCTASAVSELALSLIHI